MDEKIYMRHTGYPGARTLTAKVLQKKTLLVEKAVKECYQKQIRC
jgi:hypothetical protein